jgi:hypothetical protein
VFQPRVLKLQATCSVRTLLTRRVHPKADRIATTRTLITVVLAGVLVAAGAVPGIAQVATPTFADLRSAGHWGETVYITDQSGTTVKGRIVRISATSIELLVNDVSREWVVADVTRIRQGRRHAMLGTKVGLVVGFGLGALVVLTDPYCRNGGRAASSDWCGPEAVLLVGGVLGGIGAGAGAAIGAAIRTERVLYAAPNPSTHGFSLRVAPGVIGMRAGLRF